MKTKTPLTACSIEQAVLLFKNTHDLTSLVLAYSGGMDSSVLLHALVRQGLKPRLVHVHHGLQACADDWVAHALQQAAHYGFDCHIERVRLADQSRRGMEDLARSARYAALWQQVAPQAVLLTAHHQRDQAETLLLRLLRGAGVKGLGGIQPEQWHDQGRRLCRPLLSVPYADLLAYAQRHQLRWVEDPSNQQAIALRNQVRHHLLPLMQTYQLAIERKLAQTAAHCQEADALLSEMAAEDWQKLALSHESWSLSAWQGLRWPRARLALTYRLSLCDESLSQPQWQQVKQQFYDRVDAQTHPRFVLAHHQLVLGDDCAYCLPMNWLMPAATQKAILTVHPQIVDWMPWLALSLSASVALPMKVSIQQRKGGERLCVNGKSRSLKSWLQKAQIAHWQMALWPVIYDDKDQLIGWPGMPKDWWETGGIVCAYALKA